jgi:ABC-2 type transport system permease protein
VSAERDDARADDRGVWRVVARREFWVRLRDRGFLISTSITLVVLSGFILFHRYGGSGGPATFELGTLGPGSAQTAPLVQQLAHDQSVTVHVQAFNDGSAADAALTSGRADAILANGDSLLVFKSASPVLVGLVQSALQEKSLTSAMKGAGVQPGQIEQLLHPPPLPVSALQPQSPNSQQDSTIALVGVFLLYGQLFGYGVWVASGVVEEKSSRVVELLLSSIRPRQLLAGKLIGIGSLGLLQLTFIATWAIALSLVIGSLHLPLHATGIALLVLFWFGLGFAFYSSLFAVAGALVSRMEELQNAIVPINLVILASFAISLGASQAPDSLLARTVAILPFSSSLAMPPRIAMGDASPIQIAVSIGVLVGSTLVLVPIAARVYSGAVLRIGARVKVRDAWSASDR